MLMKNVLSKNTAHAGRNVSNEAVPFYPVGRLIPGQLVALRNRGIHGWASDRNDRAPYCVVSARFSRRWDKGTSKHDEAMGGRARCSRNGQRLSVIVNILRMQEIC